MASPVRAACKVDPWSQGVDRGDLNPGLVPVRPLRGEGLMPPEDAPTCLTANGWTRGVEVGPAVPDGSIGPLA